MKYLLSQDFTNGADGQIQFMKDGQIIPVYGASKFKATSSPTIGSRGQIGTRNKQHRIKDFENKIKLTADYYMVAVITEWLKEMKKTGVWPKIDMMAVNTGKGTSMGMMSKTYYDLVPDGEIPLQELDDAAADGLMAELTFKFRDWEDLENFKMPTHVGNE